MSNPPTTLPVWATSGAAQVNVPPGQRQALGWVASMVPPAGYVNWFYNLVYQWIAHLSKASAKYATLQEAAVALSAGDTCIVDEYDLDAAPGQKLLGVTSWGADGVLDLAADGAGVVVLALDGGTYSLARYARDDLATVMATYTLFASIWTRVVTNGQYVLAINTTGRVACYDVAGGAELWSYTNDASVSDVCLDGVRAYICGGVGASNRHVRALTLADGTVEWSYNHGLVFPNTLKAICTNGRQVFVAGDASTFPSGATVRALEATSGNDFNNEGASTATSTDKMSWNRVTTLTVRDGMLRTDGTRLFIGYGVGAGNEVELIDVTTGLVIAGYNTGANVTGLAVDQDHLYVAIDAVPPLMAFHKDTMRGVWAYPESASITLPRVATDGAAVFLGLQSGSTTQLNRINRGNRARVWRRVDPADRYLPYRQLIIPEE